MRGKIVKKTQEQALQAQYNFKTKVQLARTRKGKESGKVEEAVNHQMVKISVILILIKVNLQRKEMVANIKTTFPFPQKIQSHSSLSACGNWKIKA